MLIADADRAPVIDEALDLLRKEGAPTPHVLQALDPQAAAPLAGSESSSSSSSSSPSSSSLLSSPEYEALVQSGRSSFAWEPPADEFDALSLNYTSGSTGRPKGCVLHHRGAYLTALGNMSAFGGMASEGATRYLWTLPMFHCNGWNFPYTIAALTDSSSLILTPSSLILTHPHLILTPSSSSHSSLTHPPSSSPHARLRPFLLRCSNRQR